MRAASKCRVLRSYGAVYHVLVNKDEYCCVLRGKFRLKSEQVVNPVAVGDIVDIEITGEKEGVIEKIHPRHNRFSRLYPGRRFREQIIAANIDQLVVIASVLEPRLNLNTVDRFLIAGEKGHLKGVLCLNKIDLKIDDGTEDLVVMYRNAGYDVLLTSAVTGEGLDELRSAIRRKISVFAGVSGAGKSSLLNRLNPESRLPVRGVSTLTGKGKHTTSSVQLITIDEESFVADTPGIRELGLWDVTRKELSDCYPEIRESLHRCRFSPCYHVHEPDCAVKRAVQDGTIDPRRYDSYLKILETLHR
jgi:ribosome biogenesis GTPase